MKNYPKYNDCPPPRIKHVVKYTLDVDEMKNFKPLEDFNSVSSVHAKIKEETISVYYNDVDDGKDFRHAQMMKNRMLQLMGKKVNIPFETQKKAVLYTMAKMLNRRKTKLKKEYRKQFKLI